GNGGTGPVITPGGFYPILRVTPLYPASCAAREVEGQVTVQYDVTNGGVVVNAMVVDSTDGCLDRAALRAIEGWKYSPLLEADPDGIQESGLTQTFEFELEDS
ncbi:MAG: energy transducer TonB, partial [Pseudomonadota bacterium]